MKQEITAAEAMEAIERLRIDMYPLRSGKWCATVLEPVYKWGWGDSAIGAVAQLLERIGETAMVRAEVANV